MDQFEKNDAFAERVGVLKDVFAARAEFIDYTDFTISKDHRLVVANAIIDRCFQWFGETTDAAKAIRESLTSVKAMLFEGVVSAEQLKVHFSESMPAGTFFEFAVALGYVDQKPTAFDMNRGMKYFNVDLEYGHIPSSAILKFAYHLRDLSAGRVAA